MKNKNVGYLIVGISIIVFAMIFIFNAGLKEALGATCSMGPTCGMYKTLSLQTWVSVAIAGLILIIGLFFIFSKEEVSVITKTVVKKESRKKISLEGLDDKEKKAVKLLQEQGAIFQATLMESLGIGKVGITRLLDKLEAKQIVERKRRGMNNVVVLKH
jgi:uncharacterized membrane protein